MGRRAWWLAEVVFSFSTGRPCWRAMLLVHLCWLLVAEENLHTRCSESTGPIPVASRFSYTTTQLCFYTTEQLCFRIFTHCHLSICIHIFCIVQFFTYHKFSQNFEIHPRPALCLSSFSLLQVVHLYDRFHGKCHTLQKSGEIKSVATGTHDTLTMVCSGWFGIDGDRFYFPWFLEGVTFSVETVIGNLNIE